ncbi:hypothetical protein TGMAS_414740 [Toxoplasma gondii MAS]|uniref:Uncharacterized protein n=1 Tax=Toxoplasma gondii MAS TaxID=943118 RepID=A0A086QK61_TOXGO|nr:hypothetical protein TGMAS_414740 [Toxoplasma gondii MAS]
MVPLLFWLTGAKAQVAVKDQYAPLTSVAVQAVAFLHSHVEGFNTGRLKRFGATLKTGFANLARRGTGRRQQNQESMNSWGDIEMAMQERVRLELPRYRGSLDRISRFSNEFRRKFVGHLPVGVSAMLMVLMALWAQDPRSALKSTFSSESGSRAKAILWLMTFVHRKSALFSHSKLRSASHTKV